MNTKTGILTAMICLLFISSVGFCDGGTLSFRETKPEKEFIFCPDMPYYEEVDFTSEEVSMLLNGEEPDDVWFARCLLLPSFRFVFTRTEPCRLFIDRNNDGKPQPDEIHTPDEQRSGWCQFDNLPAPMRIDDGTRTVRQEFQFIPRSGEVIAGVVNSGYVGSMAVGKNEYSARLTFRSLLGRDDVDNEIIILDTNGDGRFDYRTDTCFSAEGVAFIDNKPWRVITTLRADTATVSLTPYGGKVGSLKIAGDGICRLLFGSKNQPAPDFDETKAFLVTTVCSATSECLLPAGEYELKEAFLQSDEKSPILYRAFSIRDFSALSVGKAESAVTTLPFGGPMFARVTTSSVNVTGMVGVNYSGPENSDGTTFGAIRTDQTDLYAGLPAPIIEIANGAGKVVASAQVEYG